MAQVLFERFFVRGSLLCLEWCSCLAAMAKSKNHTGHNQNYKNHRNGIKKTRPSKTMSMRGMNCKFVRNQAFAKRGMSKAAGMDKDERAAAQKEAQKKLETKKEALRVQKIKDAEKEAADAKLKALSSKKGK